MQRGLGSETRHCAFGHRRVKADFQTGDMSECIAIALIYVRFTGFERENPEGVTYTSI